MIKSGKYRHRIHIQKQKEPVTQDQNTGAITVSWETLVVNGKSLSAYPAEVLTGAGREVHAAGTKLADLDARINCRWFPGLTESMRILWEGKVFDILGIETDATARREYRIKAKHGLTDGN
jgi:head-tail adaptor